jgi:hypothetical protein
MQLPQPNFPGVRRPVSDFAAVRTELQTGLLQVNVDLSVARSLQAGTALVLNVSGNALYVDQKALSGVLTLQFNDEARGGAQVTAYPGFIARLPFVQIVVENTAQPGLSARLLFGTDVDFEPTAAAGVSILTPVNSIESVSPACQILSANGVIGVGTTVGALIPAASNPNGIIIREAYLQLIGGAGGSITSVIIAAPVAPVTVFTPQVPALLLLGLANSTTNQAATQESTLARQIPAGWGVFLLHNVTVAAGTAAYYLSAEIL